MGDEDLDGMLQKIVELLRANGESWNDTLLISQPDAGGNYTFTAEEGSTRDLESPCRHEGQSWFTAVCNGQ